MSLRQMGWLGLLVALLFLTPGLVRAQIQIQLPQGWPPFSDDPRPPHPESHGDEPRGVLEIINDWQDRVNITVWSNQRERIGEWVLNPGSTNTFEESGHRIKVRPHYKIKGLCRNFCSGGHEGIVAPVWEGITRPESRTIRP